MCNKIIEQSFLKISNKKVMKYKRTLRTSTCGAKRLLIRAFNTFTL